MKQLDEGLEVLNDWLKTHDLKISLAVIGRYAFYLSGITSVSTVDIDTVTPIEEEIYQKIIAIGLERGMKQDWLNDHAESIPLPEGFHERLVPSKGYSQIEIKHAARVDLIALKAAAYVGRGRDDPKDYQDLLLLRPSRVELEMAEGYVRRNFSPPVARFEKDFEESLHELRALAKD
jgi:hypothetical protein